MKLSLIIPIVGPLIITLSVWTEGSRAFSPPPPFCPYSGCTSNSSFLVIENGGVVRFGWNGYGQLGCAPSDATDVVQPIFSSDFPRAYTNIVRSTQLTAGVAHSILRGPYADDDTEFFLSWGSNRYGQLGISESLGTDEPVVVPKVFLKMVFNRAERTYIAAGAYHTLVGVPGKVFSFGRNNYGQLGHAANSGTDVPNCEVREVFTLSPSMLLEGVAAGAWHSVVVAHDGQALKDIIMVFGLNTFGQLGVPNGVGTMDPNPVPIQAAWPGVQVAGLLTAGEDFTIAGYTCGLWGFGNNQYGQLGHPSNAGQSRANPPGRVTLDTDRCQNIISKVVAGRYHVVALRDTDAVHCWGNNRYGQCGTDTNAGTDAPNPIPVRVPLPLPPGYRIYDIAAGAYHTLVLAVRDNDKYIAYSWGRNDHGQLGRPENFGTDLPNPNPGIIDRPVVLDVEFEAWVEPAKFVLAQNYPNPFNPTTTIEYTMPHAGYVTLRVLNVLGETVATLVSGQHEAGAFTATWDASGLPSGVYFYRLSAGECVQTRKMVLTK